jgi:RNA polymerase sigma factor (sigma-70 family)
LFSGGGSIPTPTLGQQAQDTYSNLADILEVNHQGLVRYAASRVPWDTAEDVVQNTALKLMEKVPGGEIGPGFFLRSLHNAAIDQNRYGARRPTEDLEKTVMNGGGNPYDYVAERGLVNEVIAAIGMLPQKQRQSIVLTTQGFSMHEIAQMFGRTYNAVKSDVWKARGTLMRRLSPDAQAYVTQATGYKPSARPLKATKPSEPKKQSRPNQRLFSGYGPTRKVA